MNAPALLIVLSFAAAPSVEVRTLSGQAHMGTLLELSSQRVVLATDSGEQTLATKDLLAVRVRAAVGKDAAKPQVWIELVDGTRLAAVEYTSRAGQATAKLVDGQDLTLSTKLVTAVRLKEQNEKIARQWADIVSAKRASDVIVIRREEAIDFLEGVLGDVSAEAVQFKLEGDAVNVKRPRVEGFLYFHPSVPALPPAVCEVAARDGSRIPATRIELREEQLLLVTPSGLQLTRSWESIQELDFSLGKLRYLSDLQWDTVERQGYLGSANAKPDRFFEPRRDASFLGPLRLGNKTYTKGIALKSQTKIVYRLPGKFSRLTGMAGINVQVAPAGHVRLVIRGDQHMQPLLDTTLSGTDAPLPLSLDLSGVRRLTIEVDFGEAGDAGDHLNLCDVRIIQ